MAMMSFDIGCVVYPTGLYKKGLIYLIIPIADQDTIVVPPLQVCSPVMKPYM